MNNRRETRNWIIWLLLVLVFSFFAGYYANYRINYKEKTKLEIIQEIMENEWYYGIDDEDFEQTLEIKMILGMLDLNKDPFTQYLVSLGPLADSYTGIGVTLEYYGEYFVISEVDSQNSISDGIKVGDILLKVNGIDLKNKTIKEFNKIVSEKKDGIINLVLKRGEVEVGVSTEVVSYAPLTVFTKNYDDVSYVKISEFNLDTASHLDKYFSSLSDNITGLVLDLRGNPGGYVSSVREVLDLFVSRNKVVMSTVDKHGNETVIKTVDDNKYIFDNIVVLIDDMSASGAEALASALNYHLDDVVTLYGDITYGKGSAQKTHDFGDGTYFHYTYALWNTPYGETINKKGVDPEIESINKGISSLEFKFTTQEIKLHDYGEGVLNLQMLLKKLNLYSGDEHAFMDKDTVEALKLFQTNNNLEVSGKLDTQTLRFIQKIIYDDKIEFLDNQLQEVLGSMFS